jgi:hypothetical protein
MPVPRTESEMFLGTRQQAPQTNVRFGSEADIEPAQLAFEAAHFPSLREANGSLSAVPVCHPGLTVTSVTSVTDADLKALPSPTRLSGVTFVSPVLTLFVGELATLPDGSA